MAKRFRRRRGVSTVQWCFVAGAITLAIVGGMALMGNATNSKLNENAENVADPAKLSTRF